MNFASFHMATLHTCFKCSVRTYVIKRDVDNKNNLILSELVLSRNLIPYRVSTLFDIWSKFFTYTLNFFQGYVFSNFCHYLFVITYQSNETSRV